MHRSVPIPWLLLALLLPGVLLPHAGGRAAADPPSSTEAWYDMDREAWMRTGDERLVLTRFDLRNGPNLAEVPFQIGD